MDTENDWKSYTPDLPSAMIQFAAPEWWAYAAGLAIAGMAGAFWSVRGLLRTHPRSGWTAFFLRSAGVALITICLLEPQWISERRVPGEGRVVVLIDRGASLGVEDAEGGIVGDPVLEVVDDAAMAPGGWISTLKESFTVETYTFDERLEEIDLRYEEITFDGRSSNLALAVRRLYSQAGGTPVVGVVLLSDGNFTDRALLPDVLDAHAGVAEGAEVSVAPIFAVALDGASPMPDVAIDSVQVNRSAFEDAPLSVTAGVSVPVSDQEDRNWRVLLRDAAGGTVVEESVRVPAGSGRGDVRFEVASPEKGVSFYTVEVDPGGGREATVENNSRRIVAQEEGGPFRLLYVAGRPNWEYKFLKRALDPDEEVSVVGLHRVAKREPKFEWRGRSGETSNPLFRGFGAEADDDAGYDKPVLVRLNVNDEQELADGFPTLEEELFRYHALVLDDLEAEFFTLDQQEAIREFVSRRGGGLLMLGGQESLSYGGYRRTPVGDVIPVSLDIPRGGRPGEKNGINLTREGMLTPWVRLRRLEGAEEKRLEKMPEFRLLNPVGRTKPGASALVESEGNTVLATHRFGRGRGAVLAIGDVWRWGMKTPELRRDMEKAWRQTVRWLVGDVPGRLAVTTNADPAAGPGVVAVQVDVKDGSFEPDSEAGIVVEVAGPGGDTVPLALTSIPGEEGSYSASFQAVETGGYRILAKATPAHGEDGSLEREELTASTGWVHDPVAAEFARLGIDREGLGQVAEASGGTIVTRDQLAGLADVLSPEIDPVTEVVRTDLWHLPWVIIIAITLLVGDWRIRRKEGFA